MGVTSKYTRAAGADAGSCWLKGILQANIARIRAAKTKYLSLGFNMFMLL